VSALLHQMVVAFEEILSEMGVEVAASPVRIIAEWLQFALLIAIIWVVAMGWGKRKGFVANLLAERAERIGSKLEISSHAEENLTLADNDARELLHTADAEAKKLVAAARAESQNIEETARVEADAEALRITARAKDALATQTEEMRSELREELVEIVAQASRAILSEKMSVSEQRDSIERAILGSLGPKADAHVSDNGSRKPTARPAATSRTAS
jgi:F0F1-type ATP synthase membrane subunit b/b'